jgi:hypothetical protein
MDLREYDYITERSDTLPKGTLEATRKVLADSLSANTHLIDKVLSGGYIEPPAGYKWHGYYRIILSKPEIKAIFDDLIKAESLVSAKQPDSEKALTKLGRLISCWSHPLHETPESYEEYKSKQIFYDLKGISFDAFLDLIFEHPVSKDTKTSKAWYWQVPIDRWIDMDKAEGQAGARVLVHDGQFFGFLAKRAYP